MKFILTTFFLLILSGFCFAQNPAKVSDTQNEFNNSTGKLESLKKEKILAEAKRKVLLTKYTEEYSEVKKIDSEIEIIDKQIAELSNDIKKSIVSAKEAINLIVEIQTLSTKLKLCGYSNDEGCKNGEIKRQLSEAFQKVVENPEALNLLFKTQNDVTMKLLVEQNQKIIELLEKLVNKK